MPSLGGFYWPDLAGRNPWLCFAMIEHGYDAGDPNHASYCLEKTEGMPTARTINATSIAEQAMQMEHPSREAIWSRAV